LALRAGYNGCADDGTTAQATLKFLAATGFVEFLRWVYLPFTSYADPASRVLPDLISLIFSVSRPADAFTKSCGYEMKHIAFLGELTIRAPEGTARSSTR
jgi:hypothetical protein